MTPRPLIVRLRNWVGDVVLGVPALRWLSTEGYELHLVGKAWAPSLLSGEGWPVATLAPTLRGRVSTLRALRAAARRVDPGFDRRLNAIAFPFSFSSALEMRCAGLRAIGHAHEARSFLLDRSLPRLEGLHELQTYWQVASAVLGQSRQVPTSIGLKVAPADLESARQRMRHAGLEPGFVMLCPFSGGTFEKQDKHWPDFVRFAQLAAQAWQRRLVICPGPGEESRTRAEFAHACALDGIPLGEYAALMTNCALVVAIDTGPGHLAAAVGAPLLSVLGPTDPAQWAPWGPTVQVERERPGWPDVDRVLATATRMLAAPRVLPS